MEAAALPRLHRRKTREEPSVRKVFGPQTRAGYEGQDHELLEFFLVTGGISLYLAVLTLTFLNPEFTAWLQGVLGVH